LFGQTSRDFVLRDAAIQIEMFSNPGRGESPKARGTASRHQSGYGENRPNSLPLDGRVMLPLSRYDGYRLVECK